MAQIDIELNNVKNIVHLKESFPLDKGLYALVGENGCGKSTIMLALSLIVKTSSSHMLKPYDILPDSNIKIEIGDSMKEAFSMVAALMIIISLINS